LSWERVVSATSIEMATGIFSGHHHDEGTGVPTKLGSLLIEAAGVNLAAIVVLSFIFGAILGTGPAGGQVDPASVRVTQKPQSCACDLQNF
jgi:hypothetical protein